MRTDLVIVGGGPVGLAAAIAARRRGLSAVLLERRRPPLDKACGEGLMPHGVSLLRAMGVRIAPESSAPFVGIRYLDGDLVAEGRFAEGAGLGVRRTALSAALASRAQELGAELRFGTPALRWRAAARGRVEVETPVGAVEAELLVGADGLHSRVRREAGLARTARGARRHGLVRHFRVTPWSRFVEVHWADGVEAYVTPVGPREVGVALLWRGGPARWERLLSAFPALETRLVGAEPTGPLRGSGGFAQPVRRRFAGGTALVGDAAGYLDPLTGEGLTLGLRCALALVDTLARGAPLASYERAYRALSRSHYRMTRLLLAIAALPTLRRRTLRMLARRPDVFDRLLASHVADQGLRGLGVGGAWRLVTGLVG